MKHLRTNTVSKQLTGSPEKERTALLDILVNQNENGIFYLENDILVYTNDAFAKVLNISKTSSQTNSILSFLTEKNKEKMKYGLRALIDAEIGEFCNDFLFENERGEQSYFSIQLKIHKREADKLTLIGSSHDITTRVLRNKKAQDSKAMFDALYVNIVDGILIYDYNKEIITDCNRAALKIFGHKRKEDFLKRNRFQFVPKTSPLFSGEEDMHEATRDHGIRVRNGEAFKTPGVFVRANGDHMIVHATVVPTFRAYGEAFIVFQDSTQRVLAKKTQRKLEKRYREIFDNSHEGIVYMNANTFTPILCNQQSMKLFGVSSFEEFSKLNPNEYIVDEKLIEGQRPIEFYASKMRETVETGRTESVYRIKSQTGEIIRASIVMICDNRDRKDPKVICFIRDVTNLHEARLAINEKNEELEKYITANLQLENFAYFASHDLQTPLRSIVSFTQLLNRSLKGKISETEQEYMDFIIASSKNMRNLVNDLLSYSRVNTTSINLEEVNVEDLLNQLCLELTSVIEEKNASIDLTHLTCNITADGTKLRQVFQNLITNAIKFSDAEKSPRIKVKCEETENHWQFSVADNGIGIHPDFQERIFLLFKRLHNNSEYEGTGIGLAMVKKIVEQHNGKIWLESTVGEGSTFYFTVKK